MFVRTEESRQPVESGVDGHQGAGNGQKTDGAHVPRLFRRSASRLQIDFDSGLRQRLLAGPGWVPIGAFSALLAGFVLWRLLEYMRRRMPRRAATCCRCSIAASTSNRLANSQLPALDLYFTRITASPFTGISIVRMPFLRRCRSGAGSFE